MGERPPLRPLYKPYRLPSGAATAPPLLATAAPSFPSPASGADPLAGGSHSYSSDPSGSNSDYTVVMSPPLDTSASEDAELPPQPAGFVADRSCDRCRGRRVRCGREHPQCARCLKGNQQCVYPPQTELKTADEPRSRVADLEAKLAIVQKQLKNSQQQQAASSGAPSPPTPQSFGAPSPSPLPPSATQQVFDALFPNPSPDQLSSLARFLVAETNRRADIGFHSADARLGSQGLADSLCITLMDECVQCCCAESHSLAYLASEGTRLKSSLHALRPIDQLIVAILCCLGARASPHSAIVGVPGISIDDPHLPAAGLLAASSNRERACRVLERRASELAWGEGLLEESTWENLTVLCGFAQLLASEEVRPTQARFLLRNALGVWIDLHSRWSPGERDELLGRLGQSLLADDAVIAPRSASPLILNDAVLRDYLAPLGVLLPDFEATRLAFVIDSLLNGQGLARETLMNSLDTTSLWITRCFRLFPPIVARPSPDFNTTYHRIRLLYSYIDEIHASLQRLQQIIINLSQLPPQHSNRPMHDRRSLDHLLGRAVRQDLNLIQLIFHVHAHLEGIGQTYDSQGELPRAKHESEWRVRMALKRASFCANLLVTCTDKHLLFHLLQTLDILINWPHVICQRAGIQGGPMSSTYEATQQEVAWLRRALEIAIFFTPHAAPRLNELITEQSRWAVGPLVAPPAQQGRPQSSHQFNPRPPTAASASASYSLYDTDPHHQSHGYPTSHLHQQQSSLDPHFLDPRSMGFLPPAPLEALPDSSGSGETETSMDDSSSGKEP